MLANVLTNILHKRTQCGLLPALDRIRDARDLAILCFDNAAAKENPPNSNMITGPNISENIFLAPSFAGSGSPVLGSVITRNKTTRTGTHMEVTNKGIA
jgi:hypothetical protein